MYDEKVSIVETINCTLCRMYILYYYMFHLCLIIINFMYWNYNLQCTRMTNFMTYISFLLVV